jgi:hypothetical protein
MSTIVSAAGPTVTGRRIESIDILPWRQFLTRRLTWDLLTGSLRSGYPVCW